MLITALAWFARNPLRIVIAGMALVMGILVMQNQWLERKAAKAAVRIWRLELDSSNAVARADTTRQLFADSIRGVTRLVEQLKVQSHTRLQARDREASARADVELRFRELVMRAHSMSTEDSAGVRSAELAVDTVPVHLRVTVRIPPPPAPTRWDYVVTLDAARFTLELSCRGRQAVADVVSPRWLDLRLTHVQQTPTVCAPPPLQPSAKHQGSPVVAVLEGALVGAGAGAAATQDVQGAIVGALLGSAVRLVVRAIR